MNENKAPLTGRLVLCLIVESRGVEPRSKQETDTVSTCLSFHWLSGEGWQKAADLFLIPLRVAGSPGKSARLSWPGWYPVYSGRPGTSPCGISRPLPLGRGLS